jgi:shikimate dehydrogenase
MPVAAARFRGSKMTATNPQSARSYRVGLIGHGIQASLSPALHELAGGRAGFGYSYELIDLQRLGVGPSALPRLLSEAESAGFSGVNITHPCKQIVIDYLDDLSPEARSIGAVNTVVFQAGKRTGHNTDCWGFAQAFRESADGALLRKVVQLGAGGAGAAVAHALLDMRAGSVLLCDVDEERAKRLARKLCDHFGDERAVAVPVTALDAAMGEADGLVHATPTGMASHPGLPLSSDLLTPGHWVAEIVYFPLETELLRVARGKGCRTIDGSGMAVYQAMGAFRLFTGLDPDPVQMRKDFDRLVGSADSTLAETAAQ